MSGHPLDEARVAAETLIADHNRLFAENAELTRERDAARAAEMQAREAVLKMGTDERFAAVYAWLDKNKDRVVKDLVDANGELERENNKLKLDCATFGGEIAKRDIELKWHREALVAVVLHYDMREIEEGLVCECGAVLAPPRLVPA